MMRWFPRANASLSASRPTVAPASSRMATMRSEPCSIADCRGVTPNTSRPSTRAPFAISSWTQLAWCSEMARSRADRNAHCEFGSAPACTTGRIPSAKFFSTMTQMMGISNTCSAVGIRALTFAPRAIAARRPSTDRRATATSISESALSGIACTTTPSTINATADHIVHQLPPLRTVRRRHRERARCETKSNATIIISSEDSPVTAAIWLVDMYSAPTTTGQGLDLSAQSRRMAAAAAHVRGRVEGFGVGTLRRGGRRTPSRCAHVAPATTVGAGVPNWARRHGAGECGRRGGRGIPPRSAWGDRSSASLAILCAFACGCCACTRVFAYLCCCRRGRVCARVSSNCNRLCLLERGQQRSASTRKETACCPPVPRVVGVCLMLKTRRADLKISWSLVVLCLLETCIWAQLGIADGGHDSHGSSYLSREVENVANNGVQVTELEPFLFSPPIELPIVRPPPKVFYPSPVLRPSSLKQFLHVSF